MALRTEIHDHLTITARELADDLGREGPDLATSQRVAVTRAAAWLVAHIEPLRAAQGARATEVAQEFARLEAARRWRQEHGEFAAFRLSMAPGEVLAAGVAAAHAAAKAECVRALLEEADALASRAHALAPWREAPTRVDGIPCRCGSVGTIHDFGDVRKCWRCSKTFNEVEWRALTVVMAHRFSDQSA
jgi:hypothetical protein